MKFFLLSLLFFSLGFTPCKHKKNPFRVISAEKQQFAGGTKYSAHGTKYKIKVISSSSSSHLSFDSLLIPHRILYSDYKEYSSVNMEPSPIRFKKNDTLVLSFTHSRSLPLPNSNQVVVDKEAEVQSGTPCERILMDAEAILYFTFNGRKNEFAIRTFSKVPSLLYP